MIKTKLMKHQSGTVWETLLKAGHALFMDTGTGKTLTALSTAVNLHRAGHINGLLIIAPGGVTPNWAKVEIPKHLDGGYDLQVWDSRLSGKGRVTLLAKAKAPSNLLDILIINVEAFSRKTSFAIKVAHAFLKSHKAMIVVDESTCIKDRTSARTKEILKLRKMAPFRRVLSGLPNPESPGNFYTQLRFCDDKRFPYTSYYAFRDEFVETRPRSARWPEMAKVLEKHEAEELKDILFGNSYTEGSFEAWLREYPKRADFVKPRVAWEEVGHKNETKLRETLSRFATVIHKSECLDLPDKVYQERYVQMGKQQADIYAEMKEKAYIEIASGEVTVVNALSMLEKLHQITLGYVKADNGAVTWLDDSRLDALMEEVEQTQGKIVIWSHRTECINRIWRRLEEANLGQAITFDGRTFQADRANITRSFQDPNDPLRFIVANPSVGKYSWTWTAAHTAIYYSNSFKAEDRSQSEDRLHRIGQVNKVNYVDLIAADTVDEPVIRAVRGKRDVAYDALGWKEMLAA